MAMTKAIELLVLSSLILSLLTTVPVCHAKTPDAELHFSDGTLMRASYGNFGSRANWNGLRLDTSLTDDLLCNITSTVTSMTENTAFQPSDLLLIPRGDCSFELKAHNARLLGAAGVVIFNTLESRYGGNDTNVEFPENKHDYDCNNGQITLENAPFDLDPPAYSTSLHDKYLKADSPDNVCVMPNDTCVSQRCLIASKNIDDDTFQACCAWDLHVSMTADKELNEDTSGLVCVFVTMQQGDDLLSAAAAAAGSTTSIQIDRLRARDYPNANPSSLILWFLATLITVFAGWFSAMDYRRARHKLAHPEQHQQEVEMTAPTVVSIPNTGTRMDNTNNDAENIVEQPQRTAASRLPRQETSDTIGDTTVESGTTAVTAATNPTQVVSPPPPHQSDNGDAPAAAANGAAAESTFGTDALSGDPAGDTRVETLPTTAPPPRTSAGRRQRRPTARAASMELTMWHAAGFVIVASIVLLLLFFFQFYTAVTVLYGIGASGAMGQLIFRPLYSKLAQLGGCATQVKRALCAKVKFCGFSEVAAVDIMAAVSGYAIGASWLYVWFTADDPSSHAYYWITQNVMGACICILFLSLMRLNSIKVATVLLLAVFIYDIFFVFITPYIFDGDSVMVTVATGGGPADVSEDYCEKYPSDSDCKQGQPLPLLLQIPKIGDFRGGSVLLGLGDIVLPGLLVSFAARLDEAKRLIGRHTSLVVRPPPPPGYLTFLSVGYAAGLMMAFGAVALMQRGQPALLYIVPWTLGIMVFAGWKELSDLWKGPHVLVWADRLARYCDVHTFVASARDGATVAESVEDDDDLDDDDESSRRELA